MSILTANLTGDHRIGYKTSELEFKYATTGFDLYEGVSMTRYRLIFRFRFLSFDFAIFYCMGIPYTPPFNTFLSFYFFSFTFIPASLQSETLGWRKWASHFRIYSFSEISANLNPWHNLPGKPLTNLPGATVKFSSFFKAPGPPCANLKATDCNFYSFLFFC